MDREEARQLFGVRDDELELGENCRSPWYRWALLQLDTYMKLASLRLDRAGHHCSKAVEPCRLQVERNSSEPPKLLACSKLLRSIWRWPYLRYIYRLILVYLSLKFALISIILYKRDSSLKNWQVKLRPEAIRTELCTLNNETHLEWPQFKQTTLSSNVWLAALGNPNKADMGISILLIQFMTTVTIVLYMSSLVAISRVKPPCDYLNFIMNPLDECERIRLELNKIVGKLFGNLENQVAFSKLTKRATEPANHYVYYAEKSAFLQLLYSSLYLVKPANLSPRWHQILLYLCCIFTPLMLFSQVCGIGSTLVTVALECFLRVENRLERRQCAEWHPDGVLIKDRLGLEPLEELEDLNAYNLYDGTFMGRFRLAMVESKYLVTTWQQVLFAVEFLFLMVFTCIIFSTFECLYAIILIHKLKWMWQVGRQLACCVSLCKSLVVSKRHNQKEEEEELVKCLTVSYLDYRLFSAQLAAINPTIKVFILPMLLAGAYMMLLFYTIATNTAIMLSRVVLAGAVFFSIQVNIYLATAALFLYKSQRFMKQVLQLVCFGRGGSSNRRIIIGLWRRQIMTPKQLDLIKGIHIMGNTVSFKLLQALNLYLFLLSVFLSRIDHLTSRS